MKKMRKWKSAMLSFAMALSTVCGAACSKHTHEWAGFGHDDKDHWTVCATCSEIKDKEAHIDDGEGNCSVCGNLLPTEGLLYELSADGKSASVVGYEGLDSFVVIASAYGGAPVTKIAEGAFENKGTVLCVTLPTTVTEIGANAFSGCSSLEGIKIPKEVTAVGADIFEGCNRDDLTVYCEAESAPATWDEDWNSSRHFVLWGFTGKRMRPVSAKAIRIGDSMLDADIHEQSQIVENPDLGDMHAPEGFSLLTRFDSKTEGLGVWDGVSNRSVLWHYNFDTMNLREYSDVWFAVKMVGGYWAFVENNQGGKGVSTPWVYIHIHQEETDPLRNIYWTIEASFGGHVYSVNENQSGKGIDKDRKVNSIGRLLWDEGFGSPDGNAMLIYPSEGAESITIYCTEILGIKKGV